MRKDRILGGMYGLLIGDTLGVPYQATRPEDMPNLAFVDDLSVVPDNFKRRHPTARSMTYSDASSQALCLLASLLECNGFDAHDFGNRLVHWADKSYLVARGSVSISDPTTRKVVERIRSGMPAAEAGFREEAGLGNGALVRALPLVLWHRGSDEELVELAKAQCRVTHAHPQAQVTVAAYCLHARLTLEAWLRFDQEPRAPGDHPWKGSFELMKTNSHDRVSDNAMNALTQLIGKGDRAYDLRPENATVEVLEACRLLGEFGGYQGFKRYRETGGFHAVDTFYSAIRANGFAAMNMQAERSCRGVSVEVMIADNENIQNEYENVLRAAIQYGNDTNTTSAVAGGLAGIRFGLKSIRPEWVRGMLKNAHPEVPGLLERLGET